MIALFVLSKTIADMRKDVLGRIALCLLVTLSVSISLGVACRAQSAAQESDTLARGFENMPSEARPRVWWHWVNGNVTKKGITADLEWMKQVGVAGVQVFDIGMGVPQVVDTPLNFMSPGWKEAFRFAGQECARLGLEMAMQSSGGWAESGSPWVKPEEAMKRVVWSDTIIRVDTGAGLLLSTPADVYRVPGRPDSFFYRDIALFAYPLPADDTLARIPDLLDKAQYRVSRPDAQRAPEAEVAAGQCIDPAKLVDVNAMSALGRKAWLNRPGKWLILRMGYTLTGRRARFASAYSDGLEVDKLSRAHTLSYLDGWLGRLKEVLGPSWATSFQYMLMDSWEVGNENWTEGMREEFRRRRGYDMTPFLPVLAGYVVGSSATSDRFLWDFRRTIADLVEDNHYGVIENYCLGQGLKGVYAEAPGVEEPTTADGLACKGRVAIPMGEFVLEPWRLPGGRETNRADLKEAASAAHIYGKPLAGAEAFTTTETDPWAQGPFDLKPYADWAFSLGINRFVIHTSAHQPFTDAAHKPGITLGSAGQNYNRNNTWAEQAVAFNDYLSRCSYLLQQGRFVADVLYYYGEDAPVVVPYWKAVEPHLPPGYADDWVNTEVLLQASVEDGSIVLPSGMRYRVLVVPDDVNRLTWPVVRKIRDLVTEGAIVLATHPGHSPSLADGLAEDDSIRRVDANVWGPYGGYLRHHQDIGHVYGKGIMYNGVGLEMVLQQRGIGPDFVHSDPDVGDTIVWIHRRTDRAEIYFVANQQARAVELTGMFRVVGREAELWDPATGAMQPASYKINTTETVVPLHLGPRGSAFVVFRKKVDSRKRVIPVRKETLFTTIGGPWQLRFPAGWGAPASLWLNNLVSWTRGKDSGMRYFSGTGVYTTMFNIQPHWLRGGQQIWIDLGSVKEVAEVFVNSKSLGIVWKPPFRVDITDALKPGANVLWVKVTNLWPNRLIGDEQPGAKKYCFSLIKPFTKDSPFLKSGLLGPVRVYGVR
jgi:hypothetical protein